MNREMVTDPLGVEDLWSDLRINLESLKRLGVKEILLLFGFSWGKSIYREEKTWHEMPAALDEVEKLIFDAQDKGYGTLGQDNLYMSIHDFDARLQYSNDIDIHLSFGKMNPFVKSVLDRWRANEWFTEKQPR